MSTAAQVEQPVRSTFVTVLAWIFIVLGGFATMISILQNVMINTMLPFEEMRAAMNQAGSKQAMPPFTEFMFQHLRLFFLVFLTISATTLASSIALLRRKNWARIVFIVLMALGIAWNLGGLALQFSFSSYMPAMPENAPPEFKSGFETMFTAMMIVSALIALGLSVLFGWIIKRLNSPAIKQEFA